MARPLSFKPLLEKWCKKIEPKRILEWGPGISTEDMFYHCPTAEIISIEHQKKYYDEWKEKLPPTIDLRLIEDDDVHFNKGKVKEEDAMPNYTNPPVKGKFDLIFVDGRCRVKCMKFAKKVLNNGGVVILHDSDRGYYDEGIKLFRVIDDEDGTVCLKLQ